jgi:hypothetical protein
MCLICLDHTKDMVGDHCHQSGASRDWICRRCNTGLGMFRDNPNTLERAASYIRKHKAQTNSISTTDWVRQQYTRFHPRGSTAVSTR